MQQSNHTLKLLKPMSNLKKKYGDSSMKKNYYISRNYSLFKFLKYKPQEWYLGLNWKRIFHFFISISSTIFFSEFNLLKKLMYIKALNLNYNKITAKCSRSKKPTEICNHSDNTIFHQISLQKVQPVLINQTSKTTRTLLLNHIFILTQNNSAKVLIISLKRKKKKTTTGIWQFLSLTWSLITTVSIRLS